MLPNRTITCGRLQAKMKEIGAKIASRPTRCDRFGIVDEDGTFIQPNYIIALLFDYLVKTRGWKNACQELATTNLINAIADTQGAAL